MHRVYSMEKNKFQFRQPLGDIRTTLLYQFIWQNVFGCASTGYIFIGVYHQTFTVTYSYG